MIRYAAYDPETGRIIRTGFCSAEDLIFQGTAIESNEADDSLHYVQNGELVLLPPCPSKRHQWGGPAVGWVDQRSLEEVKAQKWTEIKDERSAREAGTFTYLGQEFDMDPVRIAGAVMDARESIIAGETFTQAWVLANDSVLWLTAEETIAMGRTAKAVVSGLWSTSQYLRNAIDAATTIAEVEAITWPA